MEAIRPLQPFVGMFIITTIWVLFSKNNICDLEPRLLFLLFGTVFSNICVRLHFPYYLFYYYLLNIVSIFVRFRRWWNGFIILFFNYYLFIYIIWFLLYSSVSINCGANVRHPNGWMERFAVVHFGRNCIVYRTVAYAAFGWNQRHRRTLHCICFDSAHHHCASTLWTRSGNYYISAHNIYHYGIT